MSNLKPNGKAAGVFKISIDDGYCEWEVDYLFPGSISIDMIREGIKEKFGASILQDTSRLRRTHEPKDWRYFR